MGQVEFQASGGESPAYKSPRAIESIGYGPRNESNEFRQNRFSNGAADHASSFLGKIVKQTQTQKNSQVRKIELTTSPPIGSPKYGSSKDNNRQK